MPAGQGSTPAASPTSSQVTPAEVEDERPRTRWRALTPAVVVVALVSLVVVVAAGVGGGWTLQPRRWFDGAPLAGDQTPPPQMSPPTQPPPLTQAGQQQHWLGAVLAALVGLVLLAGLVYLARWLWRHRPRRAVVVEEEPAATPAGMIATEADLPTLLRGAESAESILLEAGGVPRDLVLRCWLALEEAAADSGAARRPSDSPTEFTSAVLRGTAADPDAVDQLLRLYHQARFSSHPLTDDDVRTARAAVIKLAATWRGFDTAMRHTAGTDR